MELKGRELNGLLGEVEEQTMQTRAKTEHMVALEMEKIITMQSDNEIKDYERMILENLDRARHSERIAKGNLVMAGLYQHKQSCLKDLFGELKKYSGGSQCA